MLKETEILEETEMLKKTEILKKPEIPKKPEMLKKTESSYSSVDRIAGFGEKQKKYCSVCRQSRYHSNALVCVSQISDRIINNHYSGVRFYCTNGSLLAYLGDFSHELRVY